MSPSDKSDRGALFALGMVLAAIVLVAFIEAVGGTAVIANEFKLWGDSIAQWIMALFAIVGTFVSLFAVILVRDTLRETRRATNAAIQANETTVKAIEQEQANAQRQLRAYLNVVEANTAFRNETIPVFQVVIRNAGQTPAYEVTGRIQALVKTLPLNAQLQFSSAVVTKQLGTVGPGADFHMRLTGEIGIVGSLLAAIKERQAAIFVFGGVFYTDAFEKERETEFVLVFDDLSLEDPHRQLPAWPEGNQST